MARSLTPTAAMLSELRELKGQRESKPKRAELQASGVMLLPTGTEDDWCTAARKQQADLIARSAVDRG